MSLRRACEHDGRNGRIIDGNYGLGAGLNDRGNALNRRIRDDTGDVYLDASGHVIEERSGGTVTTQYVYGIDGQLILRDRNGDDGDASTHATGLPAGMVQRLWPVTDAQGSATALVNAAGAVKERYFYTPEGECWITGGKYSSYADVAPGPLMCWKACRSFSSHPAGLSHSS